MKANEVHVWKGRCRYLIKTARTVVAKTIPIMAKVIEPMAQ